MPTGITETGGSRFLTALDQVADLWAFAHRWLEPLVRQLWQVQVTGRRRMPAGPVIVVANHMSYLDPIFLGLAMPRPGAFLAMAEVFRWPILGPLAARAGAMPVPAPVGSVLATAMAVLAAGHPVILFPEGMRTQQGVWGSVPLHPACRPDRSGADPAQGHPLAAVRRAGRGPLRRPH
jgi:1-acyl-sn-glycerol-3-phosphate acyltransferase